MTDERVRDYGKSFPAAETHIVPSATLSPSKPWLVPGQVPAALWRLPHGARHPQPREADGRGRLRRLSVLSADPGGIAAGHSLLRA
jgi:hypothetical protein